MAGGRRCDWRPLESTQRGKRQRVKRCQQRARSVAGPYPSSGTDPDLGAGTRRGAYPRNRSGPHLSSGRPPAFRGERRAHRPGRGAGDPDLPVVFGSVHNGLNLPGWQLPGQHVLTGLRSRELGDGGGNRASGRGNHMLLDDTPGHIQAQIKSDHQHSSLSLGDIYRVEDREGRKDARGQGAELRTDGHAVVRAAKGLLVTTEPREAAKAHILESAETQARLQEATEQHERLAVWAMENQAQDAGDQDGVHEHAQLQQKQVAGSGKALGELTQPHVVISSAAGIASTAKRHRYAIERVVFSAANDPVLSVRCSTGIPLRTTHEVTLARNGAASDAVVGRARDHTGSCMAAAVSHHDDSAAHACSPLLVRFRRILVIRAPCSS